MVTESAGQHGWHRRGQLDVLGWPVFAGLGVDTFVTTRDGGASTGGYASLNLGLHVGDDDALVLHNRAVVAAALGVKLDDFVFCEQAHRAEVQVVTDEHRGRGAHTLADAIPATDALVTANPNIALAVLVADCVPIVLYDPRARVLACVHAGWRGTVRGVAAATVRVMGALGSRPADIRAGIGPAIEPDRYQVGAEVVAAVAEAFPDEQDAVVRPDGAGRWLFDLWRANRRQLTAAGVPDGQVNVAGLGTGAGTPFFSHRAQAPCGRFAAVARLTKDGAA